jgi:hypothetical protein
MTNNGGLFRCAALPFARFPAAWRNDGKTAGEKILAALPPCLAAVASK